MPGSQTISIIQSGYFVSSFCFILALSGLSNQETSRKGNFFGMIGMLLATICSFFTEGFFDEDFAKFIIAIFLGGLIGTVIALRVSMINMPQLVAILHSFVGFAATILCFSSHLRNQMNNKVDITNKIETVIGSFIGSVTFSGSVVAFGKLQGLVDGRPLMLAGRHQLNILMVMGCGMLGGMFVETEGLQWLGWMTGLAGILGIHMVMSIGGADMPVVVSMLNSYSGWATSASGFMLDNYVLIISGALIGSSGAILSYIMCKAMNRSFISVILGGLINNTTVDQTQVEQGEMDEIKNAEMTQLVLKSKRIMIVPGYGMASAKAQHKCGELARMLINMGKKVEFCIHPVAGRMPGHMNVLLAEAKLPYTIVKEMEEVDDQYEQVDLSLIVGANDIVNPDALDNPNSPIKGMPVCQVWRSKQVVVIKRGRGTGYADIQNPLFFKSNTKMFFGSALLKISELIESVQQEQGIQIEHKQAEESDGGRVEKGSEQKEKVSEIELDILRKQGKMMLGVVKERREGEKRVGLVPDTCLKLLRLGFVVHVETGCGQLAGFTDQQYIDAGCLVMDQCSVFSKSQVICKVLPFTEQEIYLIKEKQIIISQVYPQQNDYLVQQMVNLNKEVTVFALDCVPRITRAQKLDTLSSMTNLNGYRATLEAFTCLPRFSKLVVSAAGKIEPAKVFVIGAGVAGLSVLGVAKNLGAIVRAFDSREVVKEQIESMGGEFVQLHYQEDGAGSGGYGKQMSEGYYAAQRQMILQQASEVDIIITTALIPGKPAPKLVYEEAVLAMRPGSVIVDMAAENGGNCTLTQKGQKFVHQQSGVTIIGYYDWPSRMAQQSSELFSTNIWHFLNELIGTPLNKENTASDLQVDLSDEIQRGMCVVKDGKYIYKPFVPPPVPQQHKDNKPLDTSLSSPIVNQDDHDNLIRKGSDLFDQEHLSFFQKHPTLQIFLNTLFIVALMIVVQLAIGLVANEKFVLKVGVFVLSIFVGYLVVWSVTASLHTPLMAVTNAISGIIMIGCMITMSQGMQRLNFFETYSLLAFIGLFFASINVFGGFLVTHRMLDMFKK